MSELKPFSPEWLRNELAASGRKQTELAAFLQSRGVDVDAPKVNKTFKGTRSVQPEEMPHIWEFFGHDSEGLAGAMKLAGQIVRRAPRLPMPNAGLPETVKFDRDLLPILGRAEGGAPRGRVQFNGQRLGEVSRPRSLAGVARAYATHVHGDSMAPRYEAGEVVLVNPERGYRKGDYVVAQVFDNDGDPPFGYVKKFVSFNEQELVLEQLNPPEGEDALMRFPRNRVTAVHRIVGTLDE